MLALKTDPVGVDVVIQAFQKYIHDRLGWSDYRAYGRCYRNKDRSGRGYIAEVYTEANEYKEVYWDDSLSAISFFGISGQVKHGIGQQANVHLVFFVNLAKLKPAITHRADEEVRHDVLNAASNGMYGFDYQSLDLWLENVLREYPGSIRDERLKFVDLHPVHCFRLNFSVYFNNNICSTLKLK